MILVVLIVLPGCIGQEDEEPLTTTTSETGPAAPFSMDVIPESIEDSIPRQRCVFLVSITDEGQGRGGGQAVNIEATASDSIVTVTPQAITSEKVAEVTVIPNETSIDQTITVTVQGKREGLTETATVTLMVSEGIGTEEDMGAYAAEIRDRFIPWFTTNHPELGITSETEWIGTIVRPHFMVVMFYLFFSEEWEMGVSWHVMMPPSDWARIYLRHRTTEIRPSFAFEISSLDAQEDPHAIDLKDAFAEEVWR